MKIAFDAIPLLGKKTGIGFCESGQITALMQSHPENQYFLNYFALNHLEAKKQDLKPYLQDNVKVQHAFCPPYAYRVLSDVMPYQLFFGSEAQITHFFNYIIPSGVSGKTVVTVHDMVFKAFPETVRNRTKLMLQAGLLKSMKRADRIITDSLFSQSEIIKYYPEFAPKIRVIPCGVDTEKFHPISDKALISKVCEKYHINSEYFLYLGTIEPRKNLAKLLKAYAAFIQDYAHPPKLVLAGAKGWNFENILQLIPEFNLQELVILPEYIQDEDVCPLMNGAIAFIFPSLYEGFGMPPLEAMACGTPVLVSNAASLPEVVGKAAVITRTDYHSIEVGLHQLYSNADLRKTLSSAGILQAQSLSWQKSAELLYQVYQELLPED